MVYGDRKPIGATPWILGLVAIALIGVFIAPLLLQMHCIVEGTEIDTPGGPVRIEALQTGQGVWTRGTSGTREQGRVVTKQEARASTHLEIALEDGTVLKATALHPIAIPEGWREADRLVAGDRVVTRDGDRKIATIVERKGEVRVFDLEVEPNPNFYAAGVLVHNKTSMQSSNRRNASASLKTICAAEADFRSNDRDGNKVNDYWVGDVSGLYRIIGSDGQGIRLIERSIAIADEAPRPGRGGTSYETLEPFQPKATYIFKALTYYEDKPGHRVPYDTGSGRNPDKFGLISFPSRDGDTMQAFIVDDGYTLFKKILNGKVVDTFPFDPAADGWSKLD
jgi:hypothetical protein